MSVRPAAGLAGCIRSAVRRVTDAADPDLLAAYVRDRDPAAFEAIVRRHGTLVTNVCRSVLPSPADADDAVQATFLVLARKAGTVRGDTLPGWLFRVARRAALEVKRSADRRRAVETVGARAEAVGGPDPTWREAVALLHEELDRLPAKYREPLILCYLDGRTRDESAAALRCSVDTLRGRLDRGRAKLGRRLRARGVTWSVGLLAATACPGLAPAEVARRALSPSAGVAAVARAVGDPPRGWLVGGIGLVALVVGAVLIQAGTSDPPKADPPKVAAAPRLGTVGFRVPDVVGLGFRKSGELLAISEDLKLTVWPADGSPRPRVITLPGGGAHGWRRALSPDGRFAAGLLPGRLAVWDVSNDEPIEYLTREMRDPYQLTFSPNGTWLAANDRNDQADSLFLCNLPARTWAAVPGITGYAESLTFTPDGKWLAVATDRDVRVIETAAAKERYRLAIPKVRPRSAALSPDGGTLVIVPMRWIHGPASPVRLLNVATGAEADGLKPPPADLAQWAAFSPDGKTLLVGGRHGFREWDPDAGLWVREAAGPAQAPVVYSADRARLATHGRGGVMVWDAVKWADVRPDLTAGGHTDPIMGITVSRDGKTIVTDALDGDVRLWAADTGRLITRVRSTGGGDRRVAFLPDSKSFIAVADDHVTPVVWDAATGKEVRRFVVPPEMAKTETTQDLRLSADGRTLLTSSHPVSSSLNGFEVRWDVATGRVLERKDTGAEWRLDFNRPVRSPDGVWKVQSGRLSRVGEKEGIEVAPPNETFMNHARFTWDSRRVGVPRSPRAALMGGTDTGSLVVFDLPARVRAAELAAGRVMRFAFSPDGRQVVVVGREEIVLWEVASAKPVRRFPSRHGNTIRFGAIAFTPDGRRLITSHDDCTALVWDLSGTATPAEPLSAAALTRRWDELAGEDAARAQAAGWELTDRPADAVALIADRLKPVQATDADTVRGLVAKLDAKAFAAREAADRDLRNLGDGAVPGLRESLKGKLSGEQRERVDRLLAAATAPGPTTGERLREVRGVAVLERIGAKDVLRRLAEGLPDARLTREARAALERLGEK